MHSSLISQRRWVAGLLPLAIVAAGCDGNPASERQTRAQALTLASPPLRVPTAALAAGSVLIGGEWLQLGDRVEVRMPDGAPGAVTAGTGDSRIGVEARVGAVWAAGTLDVADRATVTGALIHATSLRLGNNVTLAAGSIHQPVGDLTELLLPAVTFADNAPDVRLEPNQTITLHPGSYGTLSVKAGARVRLDSGKYSFSNVSIETLGRIELDSLCSPVDLAVASSFYFRGAIAERSGQQGLGLTVAYYGTGTAHVEAPFVGTIVAPQAELILNSSSHFGRFAASRLRVQAGAVLAPLPIQKLPVTCSVAALPAAATCEDGLCCPENTTAAFAPGVCRSTVGAGCSYGSSAADSIDASTWGTATTGHFVAFGRAGDDFIDARERPSTVAGGQGNDVICGGAPTSYSYLVGGPGNDTIRAAGGTSIVHPGAGVDRVVLGPGSHEVLIADLCEVSPGDTIVVEGGSLTIHSAASREQLFAAGLSIEGAFEFKLNAAVGCYASCGGRAGCLLSEYCAIDPSAADVCVPGNVSTTVDNVSRDHLYAGAPQGVRTAIFAYLDAATELERTTAISALRVIDAEVRSAVVAEMNRMTPTEALPWQRLQVELVAVLGGPESVTLLRGWALAPVPVFEPDVDELLEHGPTLTTLAEDVRIEAVEGLYQIARAGAPAAERALESVIAMQNGSGAQDEAVIRYRLMGDDEPRRSRLLALLPPSRSHLANLELVNVIDSQRLEPTLGEVQP